MKTNLRKIAVVIMSLVFMLVWNGNVLAGTTTTGNITGKAIQNKQEFHRTRKGNTNVKQPKKETVKINWPGGIPQRVAGCFEKITSGPDAGENFVCRINIFTNSIRYDPKTDRIRALYYVEDMNFAASDFYGRRDWILVITVDPNSRTYKIEDSFSAFPHSNGPWYSDWERHPFDSLLKDFKKPWEDMITETDSLLDRMIQGKYATLRDFDGNVLQESAYIY